MLIDSPTKSLLGGLVTACFALLAVSCTPTPQSGSGFRLPDGDKQKGQEAFVALGCDGCHRLNNRGGQAPEESGLVELGGTVLRVKTYGDLVTSIINPSHRIKPEFANREGASRDMESPMAKANLNQVMTVQQLVDLVANLQEHYEVVPPSTNPYLYYYP